MVRTQGYIQPYNALIFYCITTIFIEQEKVLEFYERVLHTQARTHSSMLSNQHVFQNQDGIIAARKTTLKTMMAISIKIVATPHTLQKQAILAYFRALS